MRMDMRVRPRRRGQDGARQHGCQRGRQDRRQQIPLGLDLVVQTGRRRSSTTTALRTAAAAMKMRPKTDEPTAMRGSMRDRIEQRHAHRAPAGTGDAAGHAGCRADAADASAWARSPASRETCICLSGRLTSSRMALTMMSISTARRMTSASKNEATIGPSTGTDDAADDERDDERPRDVAQAHVGAGTEGHDEHLQEERERSREERVHAQQQQARHQHAAVDADRGQGRTGHDRDERSAHDAGCDRPSRREEQRHRRRPRRR